MDHAQPATRDAVADRARRQAEVEQLPTGDESKLPSGDRCDGCVQDFPKILGEGELSKHSVLTASLGRMTVTS
jgi:hypothetical protein